MKKLLIFLAMTLFLFSSCELFMEEPLMKGKIYTVIIGLDYENSSHDNLSGTLNDAKELIETFAAVAERDGREYHNYPMIQEEGSVPSVSSFPSNYPSKSNVEYNLAAIKALSTEDDLTILTYSGHGVELSGELVFGTTDPDSDTYMDVTELLSLMGEIKGKKLIILDSCFSGMAVQSSPSSTSTILDNSIAKFFATYYSAETYRKPDLFVLSASAHTDSYEDSFPSTVDHNHGYFSYALLQALGWDHPHAVDLTTVTPGYPPAAKGGRITVDGLYQYILNHQGIDSRFKIFNYTGFHQHPLTTGGALDLVLFSF
ncbi:caspase family protein [Sphaerochaeta sp. PS]|uniref:caspase family protein n=1 Tax=Sphaerochaeta sp. PS TaxID=3076336 RepID=UPI0028A3A828|nr:caspase family protein [Sphaerochaeta sp. PS]MDT4763306.1 caspase family protein [Sphaerochaeta sp. PS]